MAFSKVVWSLLVVAAMQLPADLAPYVGNWTLALESPQGAVTLNLTLREENGKLVGSSWSESVPEKQTITDISKSGDSLILRYMRNLQGQELPVRISLTTSDGKTKADFDLGGIVQMSGTGTRK